MRARPARPVILLSAAAGAGFALATPPSNLYPAVWVGLAAFAFLLDERFDVPDRNPSRRHLARWLLGTARGAAFGVGANLVALRFVPTVIARFTPLPWGVGVVALALLAVQQSVRWAVAAVVREQLATRGVPGPFAFAVGVYAGTFLPVVFPWSPAGLLTPWVSTVQLADVVGERGVTFLFALAAGGIASGTRRLFVPGDSRRAVQIFASVLALGLAIVGYGRWRVRQVEGEHSSARTLKVALLQPSVGAVERWDARNAPVILARLTALTHDAEQRGAALTVWPEDAYPYPVAHASRRCPSGAAAILPEGVHGPVLTGLVMTGGHGDTYNSAALCAEDGTLSAPYDKLRLLWFGETIPFVDRIAWVRHAFTRGTGMLPGDANVVQRTGSLRASILNCFEDTLPEAGRDAMDGSPNLLINISNDAWFTGTMESEDHLRLSVLRAIEERRDLVRAVNAGPSTWIDSAGRVRARYDSDLPGALLAEPALVETPPTFFGRFGDAPTALALLGWVIGRLWVAKGLARGGTDPATPGRLYL